MRATHHGMSIDDEMPNILKPDGNEDLSLHIKFRGETPFADKDPGKKTIEILGLDLPTHLGRLRRFAKLRIEHAECLQVPDPSDLEKWGEYKIARTLLVKAVQPDQPYSAMVSAYLRANPLPEATERVMYAGRNVPERSAEE